MPDGKLAFFWISTSIFIIITIILLSYAFENPGSNNYLFIPFLLLLFAIIGYYFYDKSKTEKLLRDGFSKKLLDAREVEKKKIAAELHDSLQQDLLSINFEVKRISNTTFTPKEKLVNISNRIMDLTDAVRKISSDLYPHQLDNLGLRKALIAMTNNLSDLSEVNFTAKIEQDLDSLFNKESSIHIYRIIQELFSNVIKHSNASRANLNVTTSKVSLIIIVEDNGKGFVNSIKIVDDTRKGMGLSSIEQRVKLMNGKIEIDSQMGKGTIFKLMIPITNIYNT